jgi:glycosyltransferase involved in cell wall biosynthesis
MGDRLLPARPSNPKGIFESDEINDINEEILARTLPSGVPAFGNFFEPRTCKERPRWLACLPDNVTLTATPQIERRIRRATECAPFCYKDPRFSYTLPLWKPYITGAARVCVFRHPALTASSIVRECGETDALRLLGISYERALDIWYQMYTSIVQFSSEGRWLFVHYDQILRGEGLEKLADITGASVDCSFPQLSLNRTWPHQTAARKYLDLYHELCELAQYENDSLTASSPSCAASRAYRPLVVAHSARSGGAENVLHELVTGLSDQGTRPLVVFPESGPMKEMLDDRGIETEILESQWCVSHQADRSARCLQYTSGLRERVFRFVRLIERSRANLVITNTAVVLEGAIAARLAGLPHIWYVHEMLSRDPGLTTLVSLPVFNALLDFLTDKIVVVSESVRREIDQFIRTDKVEVIHTGLHRPIPEISDERRRCLFDCDDTSSIVSFVGTLSERKDIQTLVAAAPDVIARFPNVKFVLAGHETDYGRAIRRRIDEANLQDYFRILGFRKDALDIIANSDVLVLPSLADPLPLTVIEGMHLGKPVVATRSGGAAECIIDGVTGTLVPVRVPSALADGLIALLESSDLRQRFGSAALERARDAFAYPRFLDDWMRVISEVTQPQLKRGAKVSGLIEAALAWIEDSTRDKQTVIEQKATMETMIRRLSDLQADLQVHRRRADVLQEQVDWIRSRPLYKVYRVLKRGPAVQPAKAEESRMGWITNNGGAS